LSPPTAASATPASSSATARPTRPSCLSASRASPRPSPHSSAAAARPPLPPLPRRARKKKKKKGKKKPEGDAPAESAPQKPWNPADSGRWKGIAALVKVFAFDLLHLLRGVGDGATVRGILDAQRELLPVSAGIPALAKEVVKSAVEVWAAVGTPEATRMAAFLMLRAACVDHKEVYLSTVMRSTYASYSRTIGKSFNPKTMEAVVFASRCFVELCSVDMGVSYDFAFAKIRDLALVLKTAITSKGKEDFQKVYNWHCLNALRLWGHALATFPEKEDLGLLIYPYTQLTLGVMTMVPSSRNVGIRFQCASFLIELAAASNTFIPIAPSLLGVLNFSEVKKKEIGKVKKGERVKLRAVDWRCTLRVPEQAMSSHLFRDGCVSRVVFFLSMYFASISKSVYFPEVAYPVTASLRKHLKQMTNSQTRQALKDLIEKLEENSRLVAQARSKSQKGPCELLAVDKILETDQSPMDRFFAQEKKRVEKEDALIDEGIVFKQKQKDEGGDFEAVKPGMSKKKEQKSEAAVGSELSDDEQDDDMETDILEDLNLSASDSEEEDNEE